MILKKQLLEIRMAASSFASTRQPFDVISLVKEGMPYDLAFFQALSDPLWLPSLLDAGFFNALPRPVETNDHETILPTSLPVLSLSQLAPCAPYEVAAILMQLQLVKNPVVGDHIMKAILSVNEPELYESLARLLTKVLANSDLATNVWLLDILNKWHSAGSDYACLEVIGSFLDPAPRFSKPSRGSRDEWVLKEIDRSLISNWKEEGQLAIGGTVFNALCKWIKLESKRSLELERSSELDISSSHLSSMTDFTSSTPIVGGYPQILAHRIYEFGRFIFSQKNPIRMELYDAMLRSDRQLLFSRIRWAIYSEHPASTLHLARRDLLHRAASPSEQICFEVFEFQNLLETHSAIHGANFFSPHEIANLFHELRNARLSNIKDENRSKHEAIRLARILHPLRSIFTEQIREFYDAVVQACPEVDLTAKRYSPVRVRSLTSVDSNVTHEFNDMDPSTLWKYLNNWVPGTSEVFVGGWRAHDEIDMLGKRFSEHVQSNLGMFAAVDSWWLNIRRPEILQKLLAWGEREVEAGGVSSNCFAEKDGKWTMWCGIAEWIVSLSSDELHSPDCDATNAAEEGHIWNWPRMCVVKFLNAMLSSTASKDADLRRWAYILLKQLLEQRDSVLEIQDHGMSDWLTRAINSVRGTALENLLLLGEIEADHDRDSQLLVSLRETVAGSFDAKHQSPAVFAIAGARTETLLRMFEGKEGELRAKLLPNGRNAASETFIRTHFSYHAATPVVLSAFPNLFDLAINLLETSQLKDVEHKELVDDSQFASRLGLQTAYFYWNDLYNSTERGEFLLDRFFSAASPAARESVVQEIGEIFTGATLSSGDAGIFERAMHIWNRRFDQVKVLIALKPSEGFHYHEELVAFFGWLQCECFPFRWRYDCLMEVLLLVDKPIYIFTLFQALEEWVESNQRLIESLNVLEIITSGRSKDSRGLFREEFVKVLLSRGLQASDELTRSRATKIQESLLREGYLEYLDL